MSWEKAIVQIYGAEYVLRQLAEESAELCQAALKYVRTMHKGETPVPGAEACRRLVEEMGDVSVMMHMVREEVLSLDNQRAMDDVIWTKQLRMMERMLGDEKEQ